LLGEEFFEHGAVFEVGGDIDVAGDVGLAEVKLAEEGVEEFVGGKVGFVRVRG
jgi:hypothetical protein